MLKKMLSLCHGTFVKLSASFKRFPEPLLAATALTVVMIYLNHLDYQSNSGLRDSLIKLAMVFALGIPVFLIVRLWFERAPDLKPGLKIAVYLGVLGGLTAYYYWGLNQLNLVSLTRYSALTIAAYLTWICIPYFYRRENFELYCVRLLTNFIITYFYALVLYLGVSATLFTIISLFAVGWESRIYFDVWLMIAGIFAPAYFLAEIPLFQVEFQIEQYPKVLKLLFLYIVIPLISVYAVILYAYFAKNIILGQWPEGIVSHLVLWYGLICSIVSFLLAPLRLGVKWLAKLLRVLPVVLLPLVAMLFVAMGIRVQAYGITESRYFVLITGLWLAGWLLYNLLNKKLNNLLLPFSLAILAVLTVTGPWSASAVSRFDQSRRFVAILKKYEMIRANQIVKPQRPIPRRDQSQIVSILEYFQASHSLRDLPLLPANFKMSQTPQVFGFQLDQASYRERYGKAYFRYDINDNQAVNRLYAIRDFDYCLNNLRSNTVQTAANEKLEVAYDAKAMELEIKLRGNSIYRQKMTSLINPLFKKEIPDSTRAITYLDQNDQVKVFYVFNTIAGRKDQTTGKIEFHDLDFTVYLKLNRR